MHNKPSVQQHQGVLLHHSAPGFTPVMLQCWRPEPYSWPDLQNPQEDLAVNPQGSQPPRRKAVWAEGED